MAGRKGLVINDGQMQLIDGVLNKLQRVTGSNFVALVTTSGQPITTAPPMPMPTLCRWPLLPPDRSPPHASLPRS